jgi:hypothetical protein
MTNPAMRPNTLFDVSRRVLTGRQAFDPALREYLDEFYSHASRRQESLQQEPDFVENVKDAYWRLSRSICPRLMGLRPPSGWPIMDAH